MLQAVRKRSCMMITPEFFKFINPISGLCFVCNAKPQAKRYGLKSVKKGHALIRRDPETARLGFRMNQTVLTESGTAKASNHLPFH
jgi:hypothetical protein